MFLNSIRSYSILFVSVRFYSIIFDYVRLYLTLILFDCSILFDSIQFYSIIFDYIRFYAIPFNSIRFYSILFDSMRFHLILFDSISVSARSAEKIFGPICGSRSNLLQTTYYIILYTIRAKRKEKFAIYHTPATTYYIQHYKLYYPREAQRNFWAYMELRNHELRVHESTGPRVHEIYLILPPRASRQSTPFKYE